MQIGILSDTHGNRRLMHKTAVRLHEEHQIETFVHLGDDYADAEELQLTGYTVVAVPGLWCPEYANPRVPSRRVEVFDGLEVAMVHADKDLTPRELAAAVILYGHTHVAVAEQRGRSLYLNPGHLKAPRDRGEQASYAVLDISPETVSASIFELDGTLRIAFQAARAELS